jgi:hypothetical protein
MKNPIRIAALLFSFAIILSACTKEPVLPVTDPITGNFLIVQLNENTVAPDKIDSVIAVFKLPGSVNSISRKMLLQGNAFATTAQDLSPATYTVEFNVYLKKEPGVAYNYLYKLKKNIALPLQAQEKVTGPNGKYTSEWLPYFHFRNEAKGVTLIVAERVDDPYFEIHAPQQDGIKVVMLDRATYGGNANVGYLADHENWVTSVSPFVNGVYTNSIVFFDFADRMKTKQWYRCEFSFYIENAAGIADVAFDLNYFPRP